MITRSLSMPGHSLPRRERSLSEPSSPTTDDINRTAERRLSLHSGLTALLQAASSQLVDLAEAAAARCQEAKIASRGDETGYSGDDSGSSDAGERLETPSNTPRMLPEADSRRQSFPEVLMTLLMDPNNANVITFLPDNNYFAIRTMEFSENILSHHFTVTSFEDFLELMRDWGFTRIDTQHTAGIEVFRHIHFKKGDWKRCAEMKMGEATSSLQMQRLALSERVRSDFSGSDDSMQATSKRRLSPSYARRESEATTNSQKQRKDRIEEPPSQPPAAIDLENLKSDEVRNLAQAITSQKLSLRPDDEQGKPATPLVDKAVENATRAIFTDAVESLLRDEHHSRETYLRHEKELGTSALPGVIPISKQLFSPTEVNANTSADSTSQLMVRTEIPVLSSSIISASSSSSPPPPSQTRGESKLSPPLSSTPNEHSVAELSQASSTPTTSTPPAQSSQPEF